jgi:hypothetical protein
MRFAPFPPLTEHRALSGARRLILRERLNLLADDRLAREAKG